MSADRIMRLHTGERYAKRGNRARYNLTLPDSAHSIIRSDYRNMRKSGVDGHAARHIILRLAIAFTGTPHYSVDYPAHIIAAVAERRAPEQAAA